MKNEVYMQYEQHVYLSQPSFQTLFSSSTDQYYNVCFVFSHTHDIVSNISLQKQLQHFFSGCTLANEKFSTLSSLLL